MRRNNVLQYLPLPSALFGVGRTKEILQINPTLPVIRKDPEEVVIAVYDYNEQHYEEHVAGSIQECFRFHQNGRTTWINIGGIRKKEVEQLSETFGIHALLVEDILSLNQRPKMDEVDDVLFCLLNMLYFNDAKKTVETEQVSIAMGKDFVISFQDDAWRDVFDPVRSRLKIANSKIRMRDADYLYYSLLDLIVDHYFIVMEKLGEQIELLEEEVIRRSNTKALARINQFRKELIVLKRNIAPVRDLVNGFIRSESPLIHPATEKYFKDVYDHIMQANDLSENYRDIMISMQDLYINNVNLRMNEVMKVMAIVTCLLAPATVIGGIFGMNFDQIPYIHNKWGFFMAVGLMFVIPLYMLLIFKRRGWFKN